MRGTGGASWKLVRDYSCHQMRGEDRLAPSSKGKVVR